MQKQKTLMERIKDWRKQGLEFGFKNTGYGAFAKGIPASYFYRTQR